MGDEESEDDATLEHRVGEHKGKKNKKNKGDKDAQKAAAKQKRKEDKEAKKKIKDAAKAAKKAEKARAKALKKKNKGQKDQTRESRMKKKNAGNGKKNKNNKKSKSSKESKKNKKGSNARNDKPVEKHSKIMGSLAGIATMRRSGDVVVMDEENHKVVSSKFTVGPIQLEVTKTLGQGKARSVKSAKAATDMMTGTMVLKVKPDGSAHVKKVVFAKPENVNVKGSLSDDNARSDVYLRNSVNRMRPVAAQKVLKTARYVLKAPATVKQ